MNKTIVATKQFIVDEFMPDVDIAELDPDYDLLDNAIIDSLGLLVMIAWVEECFGITIDVGEIDENDFRSVRMICQLIERSQTTADMSL